MPNEDKTFSGSFVLDLRIWWRHLHTLYRKKHITALRNEDGSTLGNAKQILAEEENSFKNIYKSKNISVETNNSVQFFDSPNLKTLNNEEAGRSEVLLTISKNVQTRSKSSKTTKHLVLTGWQQNFID